jgi:thiamine monophosphate kinase
VPEKEKRQKVERQTATPNCWLLSAGWIGRGGVLLELVLRFQKEAHASDSNKDSLRMHLEMNMTIQTTACQFSGSSAKSGGDLLQNICYDRSPQLSSPGLA